MTDCRPILSLDLADCKKEQLQFSSEFVLTARRNDYVHAIVAYFDCQFSQVHSTSEVVFVTEGVAWREETEGSCRCISGVLSHNTEQGERKRPLPSFHGNFGNKSAPRTDHVHIT